MNELIVKACAERRVWLFVIAGTLLLGLLFIMPGVDQYNALSQQREDLVIRRVVAEQTAEQVKTYDQQLAQIAVELETLRGQTLREEATTEFRNQLVKLVRESGCQLRRLNVSPAQSRNWHTKDHPISKLADHGQATPYALETRMVSLSLHGPLVRVRELLDKVQATGLFAFAKSIDVKPEPKNPQQVDLNIELWFFALQRRDAA
jgi:recombinational DNA repair ATPase RecF